MAQYRVKREDYKSLQYNLIRSHSCGSGEILTDLQIRAILLARLTSIMKGASGIHPEVPVLLSNLLNFEIYPLIFEHGGVGASGDLIQLAHIALVLIGEGEVRNKGKITPSNLAFNELNLKPINIHIREGLSLINGTSAMTGIGLINFYNAKNLLNWSLLCSITINEIVESFDDHFSEPLNKLKEHSGQNIIANAMRNLLKDSQLIQKRKEIFFQNINGYLKYSRKVQEYYSLRCIPQILGPIYDTLSNSETVLISEINSVNDNPVIDLENKTVLHGGNFHGDYVSFEMDKIKIAITKLSLLIERQLNFLLNDKLNEILPPFINIGKLGTDLGMQGMQFTAVSTTAENQTLSYPMYVHSISTNLDNQDIVSMGTNSANLANKVIDNSYQILAVLSIAVSQAIDYLGIYPKLSSQSKFLFNQVRKYIDLIKNDQPAYKEIANLKTSIINTKLDYI